MARERGWNQEGYQRKRRDSGKDTQHQSATGADLDCSGHTHEQWHESCRSSSVGELSCRLSLWNDAEAVGQKDDGHEDTPYGEGIALPSVH